MNKLKKVMYKIGEQTLRYDLMCSKRCIAFYLVSAFSTISRLKNKKLDSGYVAYKELAVILCAYTATIFSAFCDQIFLSNDLEDSKE